MLVFDWVLDVVGLVLVVAGVDGVGYGCWYCRLVVVGTSGTGCSGTGSRGTSC
jgi:hypothetical protein